MRYFDQRGAAFAALSVLLLGACSNMNTTPSPPNPKVISSGDVSSGYGVVQSVELVQQEKSGIAGSDIGLGTVAGAVIGGVLGNQVGGGRGKTVATVIGVAGGAYIGHELEGREPKKSDAHRITVYMDDGSYRVLNASAGFRVGDRVHFENGNLERD